MFSVGGMEGDVFTVGAVVGAVSTVVVIGGVIALWVREQFRDVHW